MFCFFSKYHESYDDKLYTDEFGLAMITQYTRWITPAGASWFQSDAETLEADSFTGSAIEFGWNWVIVDQSSQLQYGLDTLRLLLAFVHSLRSHRRDLSYSTHRSLRNCTCQYFTCGRATIDLSSQPQYAVDTLQMHLAVVHSLSIHC